MKNYRVRPAHWLIYARCDRDDDLTVTFYTLAVKTSTSSPPRTSGRRQKELQAKAKAAAETAKGKLTGRGKKKAFFGDEDDDDDGAAAQVAQAVTPHGDEDRREVGAHLGWKDGLGAAAARAGTHAARPRRARDAAPARGSRRRRGAGDS